MMIDDKPLFDVIRTIKGEGLTQADVDMVKAVMTKLLAAPVVPAPIAFGAKVSPAFRDRVRLMAARLGGKVGPSEYMACMAWESGMTFSPSVTNMAGSGATGLIQFMPSTAIGMGTTVAALAKMTAVEQLDYVERYFKLYTGKLDTLADLYMAILWPKAVGQPLNSVLWDAKSRPTTYRQNAGLDTNRDNVITKAEAAGKVYAMLEKGLQRENLA